MGTVLAGVIVIAVGFGVALVKALRLPNYAIAAVVGGGLVAVGLVRYFTRPKP
ncbi:MAG: hypothetical protein HY217_13925 [Candidatus Rokubacteria bacterium]|nr:hypothetical protein [Candidatus Rokubacteria bacterium]